MTVDIKLLKNAYVNDIFPVSFWHINNVEEVHLAKAGSTALDTKEDRQDFFYDVRNNFNNLWVNEDADAAAVSCVPQYVLIELF